MKLIKISNTEVFEQYKFLLELKKFYEYVNFLLNQSPKRYLKQTVSITETWKDSDCFLCLLLRHLGHS